MRGRSASPSTSPTGRHRRAQPLLELDDLDVYYGRIDALKGVSLTVDEGEIVTLIGANGAGKRRPCGRSPGCPAARGHDPRSTGQDDHRRRRRTRSSTLGIASRRRAGGCSRRMSVRENLELGAFQRTDRPASRADMERVLDAVPAAAGAADPAGRHAVRRRAADAGDRPGADGAAAAAAAGRAVAGAGAAPGGRDLRDHRARSTAQGTTILLVEQNARTALQIANRGYVLETGRVVLSDTAANLATNERVRKAYLGEA